MSSTYYDSSGKEVTTGNVANASDLNNINSAVDSAFQLVETDISAVTSDAEYWETLAQKYAEEDEDVEVESGTYSAKHYSIKTADTYSSIGTAVSDAQGYASDASGYSSSAYSYMNSASGSASAASVSAGAASVSASNASGSALSASNSALAASESADDAAQSASDAQDLVDSLTGTMVLQTSATGSAIIPSGTTAQRDGSPSAGYLRYNSTLTSFEGYSGGSWIGLGGLAVPSVQTSSFNAVASNKGGYSYYCDLTTASSDITVTLPSSPSVGDVVQVGDYDGTCGTSGDIIILTSTNNINGSSSDFNIKIPNTRLTLQYVDVSRGWVVIQDSTRGAIVPIITGSFANGSTVDWSSTAFNLSDFDTIILTANFVAGVNHRGVAAYPSSFLISSAKCLVANLVSNTLSAIRSVYVQSPGETSLTVTVDGSLGSSGVLSGIYGVKA